MLFLLYRLVVVLQDQPSATVVSAATDETEQARTDEPLEKTSDKLPPEKIADFAALWFAFSVVEKTLSSKDLEFQVPVTRRHNLGDLRWIWHIEGTVDSKNQAGATLRSEFELIVIGNMRADSLRILFYRFDQEPPVTMEDWPALRAALPSPRSWDRID